MTVEQSKLIASLKNSREFNAFIEYLEEKNAGMLDELAAATTPQEIMRLTRVWQVARKIIEHMRIAPEALDELLNGEKGVPSTELGLLGLDDDPWQRPVPPPASDARINLE